jgi:superfamily II DNA or RNA helicase
MLEQVIQDLIRRQRPYYHLQGTPIRGLDNQYWLVFKHQDADSLLKNVIRFLGLGQQDTTHRLLRIDEQTGDIITYAPNSQDNLPSNAILRTGALSLIKEFVQEVGRVKDKSLLAGSFLEIENLKGHYTIPKQLADYQSVTNQLLCRSTVYRRATAYFDSGLLKVYEEPLQEIIQADGKIRLLLDWRGFTKEKDISALEQLYDTSNPAQFIHLTLKEFLQGLEGSKFSGTEILAELVRLGFLEMKLVKMEGGHGIYHAKTGIFSDSRDNHVMQEGSNNFTVAAHSRNLERFLFQRSWIAESDRTNILDCIKEFDEEWTKPGFAYDLSQEFLQQVLQEKNRRVQVQQPQIDTITPDTLIPGETTPVEIVGKNLDRVDELTVVDNDLVTVTITDKTPQKIKAEIEVSEYHPPKPIGDFIAKTAAGSYIVQPQQQPLIEPALEIPEFAEIPGFKQAAEVILQGRHGTPQDFQYWLAQQRPQQFRVKQSNLLEDLTNKGILFEHQKSGAQHCLQVMENFGVAVCADAVGLGKTRLAAAVACLYLQDKPNAKISIVAAQKLHHNWEREMQELNFRGNHIDYELYNKNLMSRKGKGFIDEFSRYGGGDLVIIDEAHEGVRNFGNRIHKTCLEIQERDRKMGKQRHYLLLTATPWNNRREDIYNILQPFLSRPQGFKELGFPAEIIEWFENRDIGRENFTDNTDIFRRVYRELFLQRTRQMLRIAMPDLKVYARRQATWLPVNFEEKTEQALEKIFSQFEQDLFIPFSDPVRYLAGSFEQRGLLQNQRRFFLQRAESSMYALQRTIVNFRSKIEQMQERLSACSPDAEGLRQFLMLHYDFDRPSKKSKAPSDSLEMWDEDYEEEEDDETETEPQQEKRQKLRSSIEQATERLQHEPDRAKEIYSLLLAHCDNDLSQLGEIQKLLSTEFVKDHKREQVTRKVHELTAQGHKVLLISTFADTVADYFHYMAKNSDIANAGIGMAIGTSKEYYTDSSSINFAPNNALKGKKYSSSLKRNELFRLFAPVATCRNPQERPSANEEIMVLIGSETLSVGQNLQDADYLINIDLPWNPMMLEQRIGRIDRPKNKLTENIHIYYANSESQLLRQASRLANLNKKLVGDLAQSSGEIRELVNMGNLGASVYGDTLFDDPILPGYVEFIHSLTQARNLEQESFQEKVYHQQAVEQNLYTQQELLHSSDIQKLIENLGDDYQAKPISVGCKTATPEASGLLALTLQYFGPNHELILDRQRLMFWNDLTSEQDGYGTALSKAFCTTELRQTVPAQQTLACLAIIYTELLKFKQPLVAEIEEFSRVETIKISSERLNKIGGRFQQLTEIPAGLDRKTILQALKILNDWKDKKSVQQILRNYTDGEESKLPLAEYVVSLVGETMSQSLFPKEQIQPCFLRLSLSAMLLRI